MVAWAMFAAAFVVELDRYCPRRTWLIRFPVLFIFAGEVAKARCSPRWPLSPPLTRRPKYRFASLGACACS